MSGLCDSMPTLAMMYADDELADSERNDVVVHASVCVSCAALIAAEVDAKRERKTALMVEAAPASLRARVLNCLNDEDAVARRAAWRAWLWPAPAIAAAACALVLFGLGPSASNEVKNASVADSLEVTGARTAPWMAENFQPVAMRPAASQTLLGARRSTMLGHQAVAVHFDMPRGRLVMYVVKGVNAQQLRGTPTTIRGHRAVSQAVGRQATVATVVAGTAYIFTSLEAPLGEVVAAAEELLPE